MNRVSLSLLVGTAVGTAIILGVACSNSSSTATPPGSDGGGNGGDAAGPLDAGGPYSLQVPCTDTAASIYGDPGTLPSTHGAIIKCSHYEDIAATDLYSQTQATQYYITGDEDSGVYAPGYAGPTFPSGAHVYRILYRTERGDTNNSPGYSSALVFIPDTPKGAKSPIVVASHGSRGQAPQCAPSVDDEDASADVEQDFKNQVYPLVGYGYTVIAPDLAGYANFGATGNPPSAYADALDVGKSTLDGARAMKLLLGPSLLDDVILVGHSQGGGTALGALTLAASYAADLKISGAAVYTPLWLPAQLNGAFLLEPASYPLATAPEGPVSYWYLYTHGELLDGPGHGLDVFAKDKQAAITSFVNNDCWNYTYPVLNDAGLVISDLLDPNFVASIEHAAANFPAGSTCATAPDPALCTTWMTRFAADWPHFTGAAAQVPILSMWGGMDETITPDLAACVFNRYKADNANVTVCVDPASTHGSIVTSHADYVNQWIAAVTLGATAPAACRYNQTNLSLNEAGVLDIGDDAGTPYPCNSLVPTN